MQLLFSSTEIFITGCQVKSSGHIISDGTFYLSFYSILTQFTTGQFHGVGRTFQTLILCLVPQLRMIIILCCCYFIHTTSLYHVGHFNILCHSHISAMSQYKGGVGRTQTN